MIEPMNPILDVPAAQGVNTDSGRENADVTLKASVKTPAPAKNLLELTPGDVFSAEILDIQQGVVTLKIGEHPLAARTMTSPDARIGDKAVFLVKEAVPGQIMLEFLRSGGTSQVSGSIINEALAAANMQVTHENSTLIDQLVAHNLPIDNHSVQRAAFFRYSMPDAPFTQIAFLMENNFAPIERTVEVFQGLMGGQLDIQTEIAALRSGITVLPADVQAHVTEMMQGEAGKLLLDVANSQDLGRFYTELRALVEEVLTYLRENVQNSQGGQQGSPAESQTAALRQALTNIGDILDFTANIDNTKQYCQIPFVIAGRDNMAELHVMKRKHARKHSGDRGKNATALVALNMPTLGRVEVLVNKADKDVKLQFRSDSGITLYAINGGGTKLSEMLTEKGFSLTGITMKMIDEKFDIIRPVSTDDRVTKAKANVDEAHGPKRYSFDMRV